MIKRLRQLSPLLFFLAVFLLAQHSWRIALWLDPIDSPDGEVPDVTLFTTSWCRFCEKTREYLQAAGIPYQDVDIEKSAAANARFKQRGGHGVPLIIIGDQTIHGFDRQRIRAALEPFNTNP